MKGLVIHGKTQFFRSKLCNPLSFSIKKKEEAHNVLFNVKYLYCNIKNNYILLNSKIHCNI